MSGTLILETLIKYFQVSVLLSLITIIMITNGIIMIKNDIILMNNTHIEYLTHFFYHNILRMLII